MNGGAKGLFCWEAPTGENAQWLWDLARRYGIGELYVAFPEHPSAQEEFLRAAQEEGLAVYWLTGDPSWAMEPEGSEMLRQVEQAGALHTAIRKRCAALFSMWNPICSTNGTRMRMR